jgi:small subunit ribosomal protein S5
MINHETELQETVVHINRVAKVVKGGKNFSFSAVVVAGDGSGRVGFGTGKAREVPPAIQKASDQAKREMIPIPMVGGTVPHTVWGRHGATRVLLRPASPGTGVIAGGGVRAVMESAGVQDVLTKVVGSRNPFNVVRATFDAINRLMTQARVRRLRGVDVSAPDADTDAPRAAAEAAAAAPPPVEAPAPPAKTAAKSPAETSADEQPKPKPKAKKAAADDAKAVAAAEEAGEAETEATPHEPEGATEPPAVEAEDAAAAPSETPTDADADTADDEDDRS